MLRRACALLAMSAQLFGGAVNAQQANVLVPAYIWPTNWTYLYTEMDKHPSLQWTIIIDRLNGNSSYPDTDWTTAITHIRTTYKNARMVGYVRVNYANEPIATVKTNIDNYATWKATSKNAVYLDGIFFDEAPSDANATHLAYLQSAITYARGKKTTGLGNGTAAPYVVTNPGTPPQDARYLNSAPAPDLALVDEIAYATWTTDTQAKREAIWALDADDAQLAVMLHNTPATISCANLTALVNDLKGNVGVGTLWFTDDGDYQVWPSEPFFGRFLNAFVNGGKAC